MDHKNLKYTVIISTGEEFEYDKSGKWNYLNKIRKGNKNEEQEKTLANINILFNARNNAIKFTEDYGSMILQTKRLAKQE